MVIKLENQSDLERAATFVSWLNRPVVDKVVVSLPWLDEKSRVRAEKSLKFLFNDCGCLWGGPVFIIAFSLFFFMRMQAAGFSLVSLASSLLIGAGAALVAKFAGLAWSWRRLKARLHEMMILKTNNN